MKTEARTAQCGAETGVLRAVDPARLLDTALRLIARPSPTGAAGPAADELAAILSEDGFTVERSPAGHEPAPAVVVANVNASRSVSISSRTEAALVVTAPAATASKADSSR